MTLEEAIKHCEEVAIEEFDGIRNKLSYGTCQSIGMALAKLEILEKQGCKVEGSDSNGKHNSILS